MLTRQERAYRAQMKRCYKRRPEAPTVRQRAAEVFQDFYCRRNKELNGEYRPGKRWTRKRILLAAELIKAIR